VRRRRGLLPSSPVDAVELEAGIAQARDLDHRAVAEMEQGPGGEPKQVDAAGRDVLTHDAWSNGKAGSLELVEQLSMEEMDLAPIGLAWVSRHARAMLDGVAEMRITFDASPASNQMLPSIGFLIVCDGLRPTAITTPSGISSDRFRAPCPLDRPPRPARGRRHVDDGGCRASEARRARIMIVCGARDAARLARALDPEPIGGVGNSARVMSNPGRSSARRQRVIHERAAEQLPDCGS